MDYGYNDVHDRTYERFGAAGSAGDAFVYDNIRRLEKAYMGSTTPDNPVGNAYDDLIEFDMDDDGNRNTKDVTPYGGSASSTSYTTNNLNQYTAVGGATYLYDDNGNLTDDGNQEYVYDYRNLLVEVRDNVGLLIASYKYDAAGRRVEKTVDSVVERHILSGVEVIETCNGQTTWKQRFVYGQGIDRVVMLEQADVLDFDGDSNVTELTRNFYHRNALGSVMYISEEDETEAAEYRYTPYGEWTITRGGVTQGSDPLGQDVGYTGRWFDEESSLWQYRARAYSGTIGKFLQRDPTGYDPNPSLYTYVRSNPLNRVDPTGKIDHAMPAHMNPPLEGGGTVADAADEDTAGAGSEGDESTAAPPTNDPDDTGDPNPEDGLMEDAMAGISWGFMESVGSAAGLFSDGVCVLFGCGWLHSRDKYHIGDCYRGVGQASDRLWNDFTDYPKRSKKK